MSTSPIKIKNNSFAAIGQVLGSKGGATVEKTAATSTDKRIDLIDIFELMGVNGMASVDAKLPVVDSSADEELVAGLKIEAGEGGDAPRPQLKKANSPKKPERNYDIEAGLAPVEAGILTK